MFDSHVEPILTRAATQSRDQVITVFDFVKRNGFRWVPARDKKPLTAWKSKGKHFSHDDTSAMNFYRNRGVNELLLPTELNNIIVIDCDVKREGDVNVSFGLSSLIRILKKNGLEELAGFPLTRYAMKLPVSSELCPHGYSSIPQDPNLKTFTQSKSVKIASEIWKAAVVTPSGGMHFYFRCAHSAQFSSCAGVLAENVDIRAKGGVIVAPMSCRYIQNRSQEEKDLVSKTKLQLFNRYIPSRYLLNGDIPKLPENLAGILPKAVKEVPATSLPPQTFVTCSPQACAGSRRLVKKWLDQVYAAQKGTINSTLSVMAGRAFRLMSKGLSEREIWTAFEHAGLSKGLTQEEVINTLRSARDYGIVRQFRS